MKRLKILIYGDQNLNILDGSSIWMTSLINILSNENTADIHVLLKTPIRRKQVISNINRLREITFINPFTTFHKHKFEEKIRLTPSEASVFINVLDQENNYDIVITRGKQVTLHCLNKDVTKKLIPYITDFDHSNQDSEDLKLYREIYNQCPRLFVQTEEMRDFIANALKVSPEKFIILPPTVKDSKEKPEFKINNYSLIYTGKFASDWKTKELIKAYIEAKKKVDTLTLNIAGDKFQGELAERKEQIIEYIQGISGLNWVGAVSRGQSLKLIEHSDVGYAFRSSEIDNNNSLELSTKFLEYSIAGKPVLVRKINQYVKLLGEDYPFYCDSFDELVDKIILAFEKPDLYKKAAEKCYNASLKFQISHISSIILEELYKLSDRKKTILFAGHDFKFIQWYIDYMEDQKDINVLIDKWQGHNKHDEEKSLNFLKQADIIFCEWGLGNSVFYSNNKLPGQRLFIRVHRQELTTEYLQNVKYENVENVLAISPFIYEEFARIHPIPRNKMKVIPNMVNVKKFSKPKSEEFSKYHIGILGILPQLKRLDRAVDILEKLWNRDSRFKLYIKSRLPHELAWLKNRPDEISYYDKIFEKIENAPWKDNVIIESHGEDVAEWFQKINFTLSTSDIESFHLAPMEGMASNTIPIVFNWEGANTLYPEENIVTSVDEAVELIFSNVEEKEDRQYRTLVEQYSEENITEKLNSAISIFK
ncbi:glycosyltransferase involved in cell wall biosynthesis [Gracilibacillus halotolerans]|uniref:Glycosyltransferase involved in cell wall biosynthesis n=1 Tax=Gracilibacillus halotolerans TaxID=74386 RepID=A0A841RNY3_9BACI|nr:glycosyltransferase [Gracilibacillus halotolerans]MBB6513587.1 glycosyltransferase involved in cell wall biosynthesis [Gracilibacillus halotolerans]